MAPKYDCRCDLAVRAALKHKAKLEQYPVEVLAMIAIASSNDNSFFH